MSTGYQIKNQEGLYFLTFQVINWIDIFTRKVYRDILIDNLRYCQENKGLQVFAYVIMSNHVHIVVNSTVGKLSDTIRDFKKYTSRVILETIQNGTESRREWMLNQFEFAAKKHSRNQSYQFWTHENHAIELLKPNFIAQKLDYIHHNPVKAGIVLNPEDYLYSSARNYADMENLLDIALIDMPWKTYC